MKLNEIIDEIFDIASAIEYNTISYFHPLLVSARNEAKPDELLLAVAVPLKQAITNGTPISKVELAEAVKSLKKIGQRYKIVELKQLTKNLEQYIDSLG